MRKNSTPFKLVALFLLFSTGLFAANFTVTSNADSGPGTLRQALADANALPGTDNILFNLSGSTQITLLTPLVVNSAVNIQGYTQPGSAVGPIATRTIVVAVTAPGIDAIDVNNGNVSISGLAIYDAARGIVLSAPAGNGGVVSIWGNNIGIDESGLPFTPITNYGIYVESESAFFIYVIPRVYIGTNGDGVNDANEGNEISNCTIAGIILASSDNIAIAGNNIGTNLSGNNWNFGNGTGIILDGQYGGDGASDNRIGTDANGVSDVLERNVISANRTIGILMYKFGSRNVVSGNYIGLNASGTAAAGNKNGSGIVMIEVTNNNIGVTPTGGSPMQANYITSNSQNGIFMESGTAANTTSGNTIMGNVIGSNASNANLGNLGWGVYLRTLSDGVVISNIIGSNDDGNNDNIERNIIAYNRRDGVGLQQNNFGTVSNNRISRNSFYANGGTGSGLGINLLAGNNPNDDITPNDVGDGDIGANGLLNYPELTGFGVDASMVSMFGTAPAGSLVQFYVTSTDAAPSNPNYKEGQLFLINGLDNGPDDLDPTPGTFSFLFGLGSLANPVSAGQEVNAIAISSASGAGNTSEFSQSALVILPVQFVNFDAQLQGDKVLVTWATAQEQNASHFEVQKSNDGISFATIGSVKAKGNSSSLVNYAFTDNNVAPGVSYYRLRQVDLDAKFVYTKTVTIRNEGRGKGFYAWPNPVTDVLNVTLNQTKAEKLMLRVVDFNGRTIRSNQFNTVRGINQISLNFSGLASGMYIIQVTGGESTLTQKIIKN